MNRLAMLPCLLLMVACSMAADGQDAIQEDLDKAKEAYQIDKDAYRQSLIDAYDKREEAARKLGDKKRVDQAKAERDAFENWGAVPNYVPAAVAKKRASSRNRMETDFTTAIKGYTRNKNDVAAAAVEKDFRAFQGEDWPHLNLE